ncbi:hypothetical protein Kim5_CH02897 [Rhizobium sp. Kim5]|uniref:hypothetical protein n=1 Tax=Rhizobium sp. Kim5 TaxID=2020311 RepID=UPI000A2A2436|nr:hypothetical protein [Rhizobium sp. Kim5]ARQ58940.1 hypothetical protein Kim5_CH02897 [Rhizobium sp. Kim5]
MSIFEITIGHSAPPPTLWTTILTGLAVALGGGIVLFLLNWLREYLMNKWKRKTEAEVLAFSLATELDRLVSDCYEVVNDPQWEDPQTGIWESTVGTPTIALGDNLPWASFPKSLHYRIRALPMKIDAAVKSCAAEAEYGDGPPDYSDYFRERELRFSWIGLEATALRFELSKEYGVEYLDRGAWEPEESFKGIIRKIEKQKEELAKARKQHPFFLPRVPLEELEKRRAALGTALEVARATVKQPVW